MCSILCSMLFTFIWELLYRKIDFFSLLEKACGGTEDEDGRWIERAHLDY